MSETKNRKLLAVLILAFSAMTLVMVALSFERGVKIMMHYVCPLVWAFAGMTLFSGRYGKQIDLWAGAAFVGWYVLSRMLMKELYLDYSFMMFSNLCCAYLLAFPFARSMNDGQNKTGLKAVAIVFLIGYGIIAWIGIISTLLNHPITLPYLGTEIKIGSFRRLWAGNHPNISACMFLNALLLGFWLLTQTRRRWLILPILLLGIGAYTGIALTDSRTTMLQVSCFAAGIVFLALLRLPVKAMWKKVSIGLLVGAACLVLVFVSFDWVTQGVTWLANQMTAYAETAERQVIANRNFFSDLATMTGRTFIYQSLLELPANNPKILLTGMLNSEIVQVIREASGAEHAHNAFLQTLLNMGIPGLLLAVFFTVRAVWCSIRLIFHPKAHFADQVLTVILLVFLVATISEPYLFTEYLTIANMPFFLIFGYVLETERALRVPKA